MRAVRKLLIANRGEIALRIIRSARLLGIRTVAVYSEPDARLPHVAAADQAIAIGPAAARLSYLNGPALIAAALASGADALHPGYGFLSENPAFAAAVQAQGLVFVGPEPETMAAVGDKVAARQLARRLGIGVVPGRDVADLAQAREFAAQAGYPILVKAAAGGGGRGMRVVAEAGALEPALEAAAREAHAAFGDGRLFLEKFLAGPRHIEVQLLGDGAGGVLALGERECSIQRRYQKIIEESPSPALSPAQRAQLFEAASRLFAAVNYRNAGTAEFLFDGENFYFLEVNARLQVEHPVTELCTGLDLVAIQLALAAGAPLPAPPAARGHAIECRIYAEDPRHDFRPAAGQVLQLQLPQGPGIRTDTFLLPGLELSTHYDGLLAKLIAYGEDREQARRRAIGALDEFMLTGVLHTAAVLRDILQSEPFTQGRLSTALLGELLAARAGEEAELVSALVLAAATAQSQPAAGAGGRGGTGQRAPEQTSPWNAGGFALWSRA